MGAFIGRIVTTHLRKLRNYNGKWVMNWDTFLQNMLLGGVVLSCFTLYLLREFDLLPINMAGLLLGVALCAGLMA